MVRNQIQAIVNSLPGQPISFLYGTANEINEAADRVTVWPAVFLYQLHPITGTLGVNGSVSDTFDLYMEFMTITRFEKNTSDNEDLVSQMLTLCNRFMVALNLYVQAGDNTRYFDLGKSNQQRKTPVYFNKDVNLTGVSLSFKVSTRNDAYLLPC